MSRFEVGYSFWGFLGAGITDTPDGGRSHRKTLLDGLLQHGHRLVLLQPDRDKGEAATSIALGPAARWDAGFPELDILMLEWRWPIAGRNDPASRGEAGFTADLDRQRELIEHYTVSLRTPTLVWDKDLRLAADDPLRGLSNVTVLEAALLPRYGAKSLLFPVADRDLDDRLRCPGALRHGRTLPLAYVGNQYDRDDHFAEWFAPLAAQFRHAVYGKWNSTARWPGVEFRGRVPFACAQAVHRGSVATVALLPERYRRCGQMTQRLAEATLNGCLTIVPCDVACANRFSPPGMVADSPRQAAAILRAMVDWTEEQYRDADELALRCLEPFRCSIQVARLSEYFEQATR